MFHSNASFVVNTEFLNNFNIIYRWTPPVKSDVWRSLPTLQTWVSHSFKPQILSPGIYNNECAWDVNVSTNNCGCDWVCLFKTENILILFFVRIQLNFLLFAEHNKVTLLRRMGQVRPAACMGEIRNAYRILVGEIGGKGSLERSRRS
jgi:hypothetical protein